SATILVDRAADECIPIFPRCYRKSGRVSAAILLDSLESYMQNHAVKACIAHQEIATPAQNKKRYTSFPSKTDCLQQVIFAGCFDEPACRTTNAERCVGSEWNMF